MECDDGRRTTSRYYTTRFQEQHRLYRRQQITKWNFNRPLRRNSILFHLHLRLHFDFDLTIMDAKDERRRMHSVYSTVQCVLYRGMIFLLVQTISSLHEPHELAHAAQLPMRLTIHLFQGSGDATRREATPALLICFLPSYDRTWRDVFARAHWDKLPGMEW